MKIRSDKDFCAGIAFIFFGLSTALIARNYKFGTASRMGPGYFPSVLGYLLTILGLIIVVRAFWVSGDTIKGWGTRPLLLVIGAVLSFAFLVKPLGLVLATLIMTVTGSLGSEESSLGETAILSIVLAVIAVTMFAWGLGIPFNIWPR